MTKLHTGIHNFSIDKFMQEFCSSDGRTKFREPLWQVFTFCKETGAKSVFVGGSFVTEKKIPNDIDLLIAYEKDQQIPRRIESLSISEVNVDIMFCSYEDKATMDTFLHLFAHDRMGIERGIAQVEISAGDEAYTLASEVDKDKLQIITATYGQRMIVERNPHKGILITIHGLLSRAEWNVDIAPIASSQGWIFAPYVYGGNSPNLLFSPRARRRTIENFREWVYDICQRYSDYTSNLSIAAHSYGTYIIGSYLNGFDKLPIDLNSVILTGSILNKEYDWEKHFKEKRLGRLLNIYSPNDKWVKKMLHTKRKSFIGMDKLFGNAGYCAFSCKHEYMIQRQLDILTHTNTIKRDIIETVWMPFLNLNNNALKTNLMEKQ